MYKKQLIYCNAILICPLILSKQKEVRESSRNNIDAEQPETSLKS